jgi:hypothetical protein
MHSCPILSDCPRLLLLHKWHLRLRSEEGALPEFSREGSFLIEVHTSPRHRLVDKLYSSVLLSRSMQPLSPHQGAYLNDFCIRETHLAGLVFDSPSIHKIMASSETDVDERYILHWVYHRYNALANAIEKTGDLHLISSMPLRLLTRTRPLRRRREPHIRDIYGLERRQSHVFSSASGATSLHLLPLSRENRLRHHLAVRPCWGGSRPCH